MSNINDGGPAFPAYEWHAVPGQMLAVGGMTLRDYFAAKAMQSFVRMNDDEFMRDMCNGTRGGTIVASAAYAIADAMLKARGQ